MGGRLAVMRVRKGDFDATRADVPDTENLINIPLQVRTVEVSLLFVEPRDGGPVRVSLRSKGQVDVARFAEQFGGGGHARAAGLRLKVRSTRCTTASSRPWSSGWGAGRRDVFVRHIAGFGPYQVSAG